MPFAGEYFGRLGKEAASFVSDISEIAASDGCASKSAFVRTVQQELSHALCLGNACVYDQSLLALARCFERGVMPGLREGVMFTLRNFILKLNQHQFVFHV